MEEALHEKSGIGVLSRFVHFVTDCMTPLIPAMLGGGMVRILVTLLTVTKLLSTGSTTYYLLTIIGNAFFYFIPIMLAASVANRVGVNPMLAMLIGGVLVHPDLAALFATGEVRLFWLPVHSAVYSASVLPIFIMVPIMKYIEEIAEKLSPHLIAFFFKPFLVVLISAPLALVIVGPIGALAGDLLAGMINLLHTKAHALAVALLAALMPFVKLAGMHYSLLPLAAVGFSTLGYDPLITPAMFCSNLALGGASFAMALRAKNRHTRQVAAGSGLSATLAGVVEPALYGVTLKFKRPIVACCIASGAAGFLAGIRGTVVYASGSSPSLFTLVQMIGNGDLTNLTSGFLALAVTLLTSFTLTLILYREPTPAEISTEGASMKPNEKNPQDESAVTASNTILEKIMTLASPLTGCVIPLKDVKDETFAEGYLGEGCAVIPTDGHVYAPTNGRVISLFDTHHAVTILSEDGTEILIHVGRDTVTLSGRYFTAYCQNGDDVKTGDLLLSFDLDALEKEGFDTTTPVVITNNNLYTQIETISETSVTAGDPLLNVHDDGKHAG